MGFQQGLSGLNTSSKALDVVGNNVSNSGTIGFKSARAQFADVFAASLGGAGGASQVGIGARISTVAQQFSQGNITSTSNALDVAINGNGMYVMKDTAGAVSYTRNGQFQLDKNGYLVNAEGLQVQGYKADYSTTSLGVINATSPTAIYIDPRDLQPQPSSKAGIAVQLDARKSVPAAGHEKFNINDPLSYNDSTSISVYDSLGNVHTLSMYFVYAGTATDTKLAGNPTVAQWQVRYALDGKPNPTVPYPVVVPPATAPTPWTSSTSTPVTTSGTGTAAAGTNGSIAGSTYTTGTATTPGAADAGGILSISVDGNAAQAVTIPPAPTGTSYTAATLAAALNNPANGLTGATATVNAGGGITITSTGPTGTTSSVAVAGGTFTNAVFGSSPFTSGDNLTLCFDTSGKLVDYGTGGGTGGSATFQGSLTPPPSLTMNIASVVGQNKAATPLTLSSIDFSKTTQFGSAFGENDLTQDGYASGRLTKISISADGVIQGNYTNGQTRNMAQIILARFTNPNGLQSMGGNQWQETYASGVPLIGAPGSGSNGLLQGSALEESTVDLTKELVDMITYQRSYQANAQTIKTQDSMLQTITNLR